MPAVASTPGKPGDRGPLSSSSRPVTIKPVSTVNQSEEVRRRQRIEAPKRWAAENAEILELIWAKFNADGEWPNAKLLQRELFAEGRNFDADQFARSIPPSFGRLDTLSGKLLLTPRGLSFVDAARPLLDIIPKLIRVGIQRYADPAVEPVIGSSEFEGLLDIDSRQARQLAELLLLDGWLFRAAGGDPGEDQRFQVDESAILHVRDVRSVDDYFEAQERVWYSAPRAFEIPSEISAALTLPQEVVDDRTVIQLQYQWTLGELLDGGGFGRVYLASSPDIDARVVAKLIPKAPGADRELLFVDLEGARNVVPVLDSGETDSDYVLVMPRAEKSLRAHLAEHGKLGEADAIAVLRDIAAALEDLEGRVVHRDLKPENVLYLNGFWCLGDFGISRYAAATTAEDTQKYSMTAPCAAPEQWRFERATAATDIYALGIMAYEMLAGARPFAGPDFREQHLHEVPATLERVPRPLAALIDQCLHKEPGSRASAGEIARRLNGMGAHGARPGLGRLQQAHHDAVVQQAEAQSHASQAETARERHERLFEDARRTLTAVGEELQTALVEAAPSINRTAGQGELWALGLGNATLRLSQLTKVEGAQAAGQLPFDVVAFAELSMIAPGTHGYRGRAHSLWYCDLEEEGRYRWYETAFMHQPLTRAVSSIAPFSQSPAEGAVAFAPMMGTKQLARTPERVVPGELDEFIRRWGDWLAAAYEGKWGHPSRLPEHDVVKNWRGR
jgi:eukaryotic-like serine/threonine-protein kinase